jgi:hypothetical protein
MCYQPATDIPFTAPMTPDTCNGENPIESCGGMGCVQSITIDALTLDESQGCEPRAVTVPTPGAEPSWGTAAVTCEKDVSNYFPCEENDKTCAPTSEALPPGFQVCISQPGEHTCPATHPTKYVFYKDMDDGRSCTECTCDPPEGSLCTATLSIYKDEACSVPLPFVNAIDSFKAVCHDLLTGTDLGSKQITAPVYQPGTCLAQGGDPTGQVDPMEPITYCCLPPQRPPL